MSTQMYSAPGGRNGKQTPKQPMKKKYPTPAKGKSKGKGLLGSRC